MLQRIHLSLLAVTALAGLFGWLTASSRFDVVCAQDTTPPPASAAATQLPKPDPAFNGKIGETYKDSTPSYPAAGEGSEGESERAGHPARRRRLRHVFAPSAGRCRRRTWTSWPTTG